MRTLISAALAAVIAVSGLTGLASARDRDRDDRGHRDRNNYVTSFCAENPRARDCRDWQRNGRNWNDNNYRGFYERNNRGNKDAALAALFGIIAGAAIANGVQDDGRDNRGYRNNRMSRHERACANAYRSYDRRTDTYVGRDGRRRECRL